MKNMMEDFERRHDRVSSRRQKSLTSIIITVNIVLYIAYEMAVRAWEWDFRFGPEGRLLFMTVWVASLFCLLPASGLFAAVARSFQEAGPIPGEVLKREDQAVSKLRKFFYYPGVYLNILAVAVLVELSGGLIESPYTPVLFGMVLAGQQLGRFRTNSKIFICTGAILVLALLFYERIFGIRVVPEAPAQLQFFILTSSFLIAALFTHLEKKPNYRAKGRFPPPQYVEIYYDDGHDAWRYALYERNSPLDPVIESSSGRKVEEVRNLIQKELTSTASLLGLNGFSLEWPESSEKESVGYVASKGSS
jgi:hypothetical protein